MITIIEAKPEHYKRIQQIAHLTWPITFGKILSENQIKFMLEMMYSLEAITDQIQNKNHNYILLKENENFVGYASYETNYEKTNNTKLHKLYLLPETQGKGLGKVLIAKVCEIAIDNINTEVILNVNRFNKAVDFYKKTGFEIIKEENIAIGNGFLMEDYVMRKKIFINESSS